MAFDIGLRSSVDQCLKRASARAQALAQTLLQAAHLSLDRLQGRAALRECVDSLLQLRLLVGEQPETELLRRPAADDRRRADRQHDVGTDEEADEDLAAKHPWRIPGDCGNVGGHRHTPSDYPA